MWTARLNARSSLYSQCLLFFFGVGERSQWFLEISIFNWFYISWLHQKKIILKLMSSFKPQFWISNSMQSLSEWEKLARFPARWYIPTSLLETDHLIVSHYQQISFIENGWKKSDHFKIIISSVSFFFVVSCGCAGRVMDAALKENSEGRFRIPDLLTYTKNTLQKDLNR